MPARKPRQDEKSQSERFIETARKIGTDEKPEAFERVFRQIVQPRTPVADDKLQPPPVKPRSGGP